jgi:hypothetical protein
MSDGTFGFRGFKNRAFEIPAGVTSAFSVDISPGGRARLRYNDVAKQLEQSIDGGAYTPLGGTGAGPWDQVGTDVFPDSTGWNVTIGAATVVGSEKLRVVGGAARLEGGLTVAGGYIDLDPTGAFALDMDAGAPVDVTLGGGSGSDLTVTQAGGDQMLRVSEFNNVVEVGDVSGDTDFLFSGAGSFTVGTSSGNENAIGLYEKTSDPGITANVGKVYTKDVSGVTQLFYRDSAGTATQLTPGSPWERNVSVVRTDNTLWTVVVGATGMSGGGEQFRVVGDVSLSSDIAFEHTVSLHKIECAQPAGFGSQQGDGFDVIGATGQDNNAGPPGPGGLLRVLGGRGGDATSGSDNGGGGNQANIAGGFGGSATGGGQSGGTGGSSTHAGGNGGSGSGGATGGTGGAALVHGGQGGISSLGGNGGDTYVRGGNSASFGTGSGGDAYLYGGTGRTPLTHGRVFIGHNDTRTIEIGNSSDNPPTNFLGTGIVSINAGGKFVVGGSSMAGSELLRVIGDVNIQGDIDFPRGPDHNIVIEQAADVVNGDQLYLQAGQGGNAAATNGRIGGRLWLRSGPGGDSTAAGALGGNGGILELWGGYGGQVTAATGTGGIGGVVHLYAGEGGYGAGGADGGAGGDTTVQGGTGGGSASGTAGDGGNVLVRGGGSTQDGGTVTIDGGAGGASDGDVKIANASTNEVTVGNTTDNPNTNFLGSGLVTFSGDIEVTASAAAIFSERAGDPGGVANKGKLYTKDVAGVTELFYQRSNGTVVQLS